MANKKIVCLGGGSVFFRDTLADLVTAEELRESEIALYDIDLERAQLMAKCGRRLSDKAGIKLKIYAADSLSKAVDGADFAIANIGGAGGKGGGYSLSNVHTNDLCISAKYGIFQVVGDTCGPAAMMAAFRTIPVYLNICREMERRAPGATFINHANPMAILCRAVNKYATLKDAIGICHGVQGGIKYAAEILKVLPQELDTVWIGTNHYYWFTRIYRQGKDLYPELKKKMASRKPPESNLLHAKLSQIYGYQIVYPDDSHIVEFYPFLAQVKDGAHLPYKLAESHHGKDVTGMYALAGLGGKRSRKKEKPTTREMVMKEYRKFLNEAVLPEKPGVEALASLIGALATGRRHIHIVNIPNKGAVPNLPGTAVLELEGVTDSCGIRAIYTGEAPLVLKSLLERIIAWQELVVDAGARGSKETALQALSLDPTAIPPERAGAMLDELLANSKEFLPQFKI
ncbi:MAG: hypothetical protein ABII89_03930 [Candidatus Omnitrophota bacterium]